MEKEVFMLRFVDCLGIKEISIAISKNESTVKTHLYRALGKLKKNAALKRFFNEEYK
jgi:RNA polymerase sigma-70 factor (ECF subfamily)